MENEYIYFATNPFYKDDIVKIGWTRNEPKMRAKSLYNTSVPCEFNFEFIIKTPCGMGYNLEDKIHKYLDKYRINKRREFFRIDKEDLANILVNDLKLEIMYASTNNTEKHNIEEHNTEENNIEEHNTKENNIEKHINRKKYCCDCCDYNTNKKSSYNNHINSKKHKNNENENKNIHLGNKNMPKICLDIYTCNNCDKIFKNRSGLWKHKKRCNNDKNNNDHNDNNTFSENNIHELIKYLMKENSDLKTMMAEQHTNIIEHNSEILKAIQNGTHVTNNNNNTPTKKKNETN